MGYKYEIRTRASDPNTEARWRIKFKDSEETAYRFYWNLADDLIAALVAKLGQEFSKVAVDGDIDRLNAELRKLSDSVGAPPPMEFKVD
jgi:hypothetical protein